MHPLVLKSLALRWYQREDIARSIAREAASREVGVKYAYGFGKRPDMITTPAEVVHLARQGMLSLHVSEEHWDDPLRLPDAERTGWDFILDIDAPDFPMARLIADVFIRLLHQEGVRSLAVKFSGNKGFHLAVPWEALPEKTLWEGELRETRLLFPELPRVMADILLERLQQSRLVRVEQQQVFFPAGSIPLPKDIPLVRTCEACGREQPEEDYLLECSICHTTFKAQTIPAACPNPACGARGTLRVLKGPGQACAYCGEPAVRLKPRMKDLVKLDTLLISSRHLFRSVYSLHEKSGLVSIPLHPEQVAGFDRDTARPEHVREAHAWLSPLRGDASRDELLPLVQEAARRAARQAEEKKHWQERKHEELVIPDEYIGEAFFPPCMRNLLKGVEDGRKRGVFILINFLRSLGWSDRQIEERVYAWNEKNPEPLRETIIKSQLRYHLSHPPRLPPNCDHPDYYKDIGICTPDSRCRLIKNPVSYARHAWQEARSAKRKQRRKHARRKTAKDGGNGERKREDEREKRMEEE